MNNIKIFTFGFIALILLSACAADQQSRFKTNKSYLQQGQLGPGQVSASANDVIQEAENDNGEANSISSMKYLTPLSIQQENHKKSIDLTKQFSDTDLIQLTAEDLSLKDYLHYVLDDLLGVSYILGERIEQDNKKVTLNLQNAISKRKIFTLSEELLAERGYVIRFEDGIFYIHKSEGALGGDFAYGYGNKIEDVPNSSSEIIQLVPFVNGVQVSLAGTIKRLTQVDATQMFEQNAVMLKGKRAQIIKALKFMQLMDLPGFKNRSVGSYQATFTSADDISKQLIELLKQEGISASLAPSNEKAVSIVMLERINTLVFFVNNPSLLARVSFWLKQLDKSADGAKQQYLVYVPQFARARDLGESLQALLGQSNPTLSNSSSASSQNEQTKTSSEKAISVNTTAISASQDGMRMVVDERSNSIIFHIASSEYRQLLPLIKRLDVQPKQVVLEVIIAEVKLSDVFKQGVEFALTNRGDLATVGGFTLSSGSNGFSYLLSGAKGSLDLSLLQTSSNVNVLSRPTLSVRDGVSATITVGDDIPTIGEIITDPVNGSKSSIVYRKTGIELQVKPTVNAQGVVLMEIAQKISNQSPGGDSAAGNPIIFERSINTEVVAESGQTIMLGGLISENRTVTERRVPFFSSIPLLGRLFDGTDDSGDKTELVIMVTPRIVESSEEWSVILEKFKTGLTELEVF